jgi:hypothetical protein
VQRRNPLPTKDIGNGWSTVGTVKAVKRWEVQPGSWASGHRTSRVILHMPLHPNWIAGSRLIKKRLAMIMPFSIHPAINQSIPFNIKFISVTSKFSGKASPD